MCPIIVPCIYGVLSLFCTTTVDLVGVLIPPCCVLTHFVPINHKHHFLNNYLLIEPFTLSIYIIQQANSGKRHVKFKDHFLYTVHVSQLILLAKLKKGSNNFLT